MGVAKSFVFSSLASKSALEKIKYAHKPHTYKENIFNFRNYAHKPHTYKENIFNSETASSESSHVPVTVSVVKPQTLYAHQHICCRFISIPSHVLVPNTD